MKTFEEYSESTMVDQRAKELFYHDSVSIKQAYEWVKTGHWSLTQFTKWANDKGIKK